METLRRVFPIIIIIMFQLIILAILNLSSYISTTGTFATGTLTNFMFPTNLISIILTITSVVIVSRTFENAEREIENQVRLENMEHLEELLRTMRRQRHDFNHHMQAIYGLLAVGDYEEGKKYIEELISEISVTNEVARIDNLGVRALIQAKSGQMEYHKIKFDIEVKTSLTKLQLKVSEINTILGNLLNNAMEAQINFFNEEPFIKLKIYRTKDSYIISVINNGPPIRAADIDKIFEPGYSTKKDNQGMGLYAVKKTVEKYEGHINVTSNHNTTMFEITLPA
ncbi:MAG: signal transduction histidine kinase regulating citrate/malate metabolism [Clostridiales bacterium]|nr:signal transduction histidine kinase regulating citrate/malate metabolism [Clostridiales bacterium]